LQIPEYCAVDSAAVKMDPGLETMPADERPSPATAPSRRPLAERAAGASRTALKALRVLEAVAASIDPAPLAEIARRAGIDKSTAHRMLTTLVSAGYVHREPHTRRYALSYRVVSLSRNLLADNEVFQLTRTVLESVAHQTGESIHLCVLDGNESVLVQRVKGSQLVAVDFQVGDRSLLHCTSIGKALLAWQSAEQVERQIAEGLPRMASRTIVDPDALRAELARVRQQGYAIDDHELSDSMRCIAAPVFERDAQVRMGISISGPDSRFTIEYLEQQLLRPLLAASGELSQKLGGIALGR
jgi:DNA-binding IclR family transcriptional regulator